MTDIEFYVHCLPEEAARILQGFESDVRPFAIALRFPPFRGVQIDRSELGKNILDASVDSIVFTEHAPATDVAGMLELMEANVDSLLFDIGRVGPDGFRGSVLSARLKSDAVARKWSKAVQAFKKAARRGAWAVNVATGARSRLRNHWYTPGAKSLELGGMKLLPAIGGATIALDD